MRKRIQKLLISILTIVTFVGLFPLVTNADYSDVNTITDKRTQNAYKVWSVFKYVGMSDEAIAGALGNMQVESGIDPVRIEGVFGEERYNPESPKTKEALKDLVKAYKQSGFGIIGSSDKHGHTIPSSSGSKTKINTKAYLGVDGNYMPGIGLIQFTGVRASRLFLWAKKKNYDWFTMETQLAYLLTKQDSNGYIDGKANWLLNTFAKKKYTNTDDATLDFLRTVEGVNMMPEQRKKAARNWHNIFKGNKGDVSYAKGVLSGTGIKQSESNNSTDENTDFSLIQEFFGKVVQMSKNKGFLFDLTGKYKRQQEKYATEIYFSNGEKGKKHSLYELFGSDVHWYRYFGETTASIGLIDHIFSQVLQGNVNKIGLGDTIFYKSNKYISANAYEGRPDVLTQGMLFEGKQDSRVLTLTNGKFTGHSYIVGSFFLEVSKVTVSFITFLMGSEIKDVFFDAIEKFQNITVWKKVISPIILVSVSITMIFFLISLVVFWSKFGFYKALKRFGVGILSLVIIFTLNANPKAFNMSIKKVTGIVDNLFNATLNTTTYRNDEVISGTDISKIQEAALWKTAVFQPWVMGQFGNTYENLYTQYSDKPQKNKMPQSHLKKGDLEKLKVGEFTFDSASSVGDIKVPVGNKTYIRNWGAYLYSVQSDYHMDFSKLANKEIKEGKVTFPNAKTTAKDSNINADLFRIIDAQMNISPQIYKDGSKINNYTSSKLLQPKFYSQGHLSLLYSIILLLFFLPSIVTKLKSFTLLMFSTLQIIFLSIYELVKDGVGIDNILANIKYNFSKYFLACFRLYLLTILYTTLIGKGMIRFILFIIIGMVIYNFSIVNTVNFYRNTKDNIRYFGQYVKNRF